jgi:RNA polymerase sigma-70 factor (ECF subfamily)
MESANELEIARAAAKGDMAAKESIVRAHYDQVYRLAQQMSRSHTEAEDLAQLTFIKACRHVGRFDGRTTLRAWLSGILVHEFSHWLRGRRPTLELKEPRTADPTKQILDREALLSAIHRLPAKQSTVFLFVEVHGLSVVEAAMALGVPEGTIKSRLSEARVRLRRYLDDSWTNWPLPEKVKNEC